MAQTSNGDGILSQNPILVLLGIIVGAVFFFGQYITVGSGISYRKRRALAKARRAKKLKAKRRKR